MEKVDEYEKINDVPVLENPEALTRRIGDYGGGEPGPCLIVIAGIHGNETGGVLALQQIFRYLNQYRPPIKGRLVGLAGNLKALRAGVRYVDTDLNRMWVPAFLDGGPYDQLAEYEEFLAIRQEMEILFAEARGPVVTLDCHSFSAPGPPFVISDGVQTNRELLRGLPMPVVLGLTAKLHGTLAHHVESLGHRALAVEGGRHGERETVANLNLFLWLILVKSGCLRAEDAPETIDHAWSRLAELTGDLPRFVRIVHLHRILDGDQFVMNPGFKNFDPVTEGQPLAVDRNGVIRSSLDGCILMPLYQGQGRDGFFICQTELQGD